MKFKLIQSGQYLYGSPKTGTQTPYSFGDVLYSHQANFGNNNHDQGAGVKKVKSYKPNAWGLYDMHGNVDEWCQDDCFTRASDFEKDFKIGDEPIEKLGSSNCVRVSRS